MQHIVKEGISDIVYHFASVPTIYNILKSGQIELTMSTNRSDAIHKTKLFYLSTQRTKSSRMGYAGNSSSHGKRSIARIELDGDLLKQDGYQGQPLDYWGSHMGKQSDIGLNAERLLVRKGEDWKPNNQQDKENVLKQQQTASNFEFEDRIFSNKPYLPLKYAKRIDIVLNGSEPNLQDKAILELAQSNNIIVAYYQSEKDFVSQNNNNVNQLILNIDGNYSEEPSRLPDNSNYYNRELVSWFSAALFYYKKFENRETGNEQKTYEELTNVLEKFGLSQYYENCKKRLYKSSYDICDELRHMIDALRRLNTDSLSKGNLSHNVMEFAQYVLNQYQVNSCEALIALLKNNPTEKTNNSKLELQDYVECVAISYYDGDIPSITRADNKLFWQEFDKDDIAQVIGRQLAEDDSNEYLGYDTPRVIHHKSKSTESFLKYIQHLMHNDNLTLYDGAMMLNKIFQDNEQNMYNVLSIYIKPIQLTKQLFKKYESNIKMFEVDGIRNALFSSWNDYCEYK